MLYIVWVKLQLNTSAMTYNILQLYPYPTKDLVSILTNDNFRHRYFSQVPIVWAK